MIIDNNIFVFGDSRRMDIVQDRSIDITATTIPFWNIRRRKRIPNEIGGEKTYSLYKNNIKEVLKNSFNKMKQRSILILHGNYIIDRLNEDSIPVLVDVLGDLNPFLVDNGFMMLREYIIDKTKSYSKRITLHRPRVPDFEKIRVYYRINDGKSFEQKIKKHRKIDKYSDLEKYSILPQDFLLPYFKYISLYPHKLTPYSIIYNLLKKYSEIGDMILDPFVGTGTILYAAKILDCSGIGFEINKSYEAIIKKTFGID